MKKKMGLKFLYRNIDIEPYPSSMAVQKIQTALNAYNSGNYTKACELLESLVSVDSLLAKYNLAVIFLDKGNNISKGLEYLTELSISGNTDAKNFLQEYHRV